MERIKNFFKDESGASAAKSSSGERFESPVLTGGSRCGGRGPRARRGRGL